LPISLRKELQKTLIPVYLELDLVESLIQDKLCGVSLRPDWLLDGRLE